MVEEKGQQGLAATSGATESNNGSDFLLMGLNKMEFHASAKLLEDPNMFIGDIGTSSDTTFSRLGFKNIKGANDGDSILDALGNNISGKVVGDVSGKFIRKNREGKKSVPIKQMIHTLDAGYNLFSLTYRLHQGWKLGGNKDSIWISKGGQKIVFDIMIKTPKGAIFCAYFKREPEKSKKWRPQQPKEKKK